LDDPLPVGDENAILDGVENRLQHLALTRQALGENGEVTRIEVINPAQDAFKGITAAGHEVTEFP
jgi:hypothetical protein